METIKQLKQSAMDSCIFRGHNMGKWERLRAGVYICHCNMCDKQVAIQQYPAPNGIDIGGEAVAIGCED